MSKRKILPSNGGILKLVNTNNNVQENSAEPKFKKSTRNPNFDHAETDALISIWGQHKIQNDLKHSSKRSAALQEISDKLNKMGYKRSMVEINTRIKNIKCMYNRMRKDIELGLLREPTWRHYDAIDQVLRMNEITTEQSLHSSIPDSALMESIGETRESLDAAVNESLPGNLIQVKTEPLDEDDLLVPMSAMSDDNDPPPEPDKPNEGNSSKLKELVMKKIIATNTSENHVEVKKEPVDHHDHELPMLIQKQTTKEKPEVEILRLPSRKPIENLQKEPEIQKTQFPPELCLNSVNQTKVSDQQGPKFIILRHQSGSNYLQPVPNNVISLNPGLKIRPISELSKPQTSQMMPTPVPQSVLKLLKEQQNMSEPPQLASLSTSTSTNSTQFSNNKSNALPVLKPKEIPTNVQKIIHEVSSGQCSVASSTQTATSTSPSDDFNDPQDQKKSSIQTLLTKIIELENKRLEIERERFEFEKRIGGEIMIMLKKLTDS